MQAVRINGHSVHYRVEGADDAPALVFSNSLGTDFRIWDDVVPLLPKGLRIVRYDKRGHGLSELPAHAWGMGDHVDELAGLLDHLAIRQAVVCGLSVGGMIAQGLAAERPDLVRAMMLCDTAAKIGNPEMWADRIAGIEAGGIDAMADTIMERWFTPGFRASDPSFPAWRNMLCRTPQGGYTGTCAAIADTDLMESTARLCLPCLGICGDQDASTPPDLVRETVALIPDSRFELVRGAGHLPCIEQPAMTAALLTALIEGTGHV